MGTRGERLRTFREYLKLSQKAFSEKLNTAQRNISKYETGLTSIPDDIEEHLAEEGLNLHWLATGIGPMLLSKNDTVTFLQSFNEECIDDKEGINDSQSVAESKEFSIPSDNTVEIHRLNGRNAIEIAVMTADPDIGFIDFYAQAAGAGPGREVEAYLEATRLPVMRRFLQPWRPEQLRALEARGDSMTKIGLFDRDIVLYVPEEKEGDGIYVISIENRMQVKRIEFDILGEALKIISENDRYAPRTLTSHEEIERVRIEGKVIGWLHRHPY